MPGTRISKPRFYTGIWAKATPKSLFRNSRFAGPSLCGNRLPRMQAIDLCGETARTRHDDLGMEGDVAARMHGIADMRIGQDGCEQGRFLRVEIAGMFMKIGLGSRLDAENAVAPLRNIQ